MLGAFSAHIGYRIPSLKVARTSEKRQKRPSEIYQLGRRADRLGLPSKLVAGDNDLRFMKQRHPPSRLYDQQLLDKNSVLIALFRLTFLSDLMFIMIVIAFHRSHDDGDNDLRFMKQRHPPSQPKDAALAAAECRFEV